jgi:signal transduction histidine kinase/phage shock protein PspC (stress-responsive transcriptional regulator)
VTIVGPPELCPEELLITTAPSDTEQRPTLYRRARGRMLAGVAGGIADHLGVPVKVVRVVFVALLLPNGVGAVLYAVFWGLLHVDPRDTEGGTAPRGDLGKLIGFLVAGLACIIALAVAHVPGTYAVVWCVGIVAVGAVVIWRRADDGQRRRWSELAPRFPWLALILAGDRTATVARLAAGGLLVIAGVVGFFAATGELQAIRDGLFFGGALLVGVGVVVAPWLWRTGNDLRAERTERFRSQERAEIAAMVHDQVLHTLALIQRKADEPREVVRLARGQERELRNWLYKPTASPTERLAAALEVAAAEVEDTYAVSVDVVVVGDCDLDDRLQALVQAAREALVNAGRHAKVAAVSLYAEVEPERVSAFVRDRGVGFDLSQVEDDRHGVRGSILARMERHGGEAKIRSGPGEGTEVRLTMERSTSS